MVSEGREGGRHTWSKVSGMIERSYVNMTAVQLNNFFVHE